MEKSGFLQLNFTFRIRIPNTDPDPVWQFESGSNRIRIRNTELDCWRIVEVPYRTSEEFVVENQPAVANLEENAGVRAAHPRMRRTAATFVLI